MLARKKISKKITVAVLLFFAVFALGAYGWWRMDRQQNSTPQDETTNIGQPETYTAETEDQKVQVPEGVPKSSIKNYELLTENEQFKIRKLGDVYTVTLYAIINNPDQYDYYRDQLREYKQNALDYLKDNNINTEEITIIYEPEEATDL